MSKILIWTLLHSIQSSGCSKLCSTIIWDYAEETFSAGRGWRSSLIRRERRERWNVLLTIGSQEWRQPDMRIFQFGAEMGPESALLIFFSVLMTFDLWRELVTLLLIRVWAFACWQSSDWWRSLQEEQKYRIVSHRIVSCCIVSYHRKVDVWSTSIENLSLKVLLFIQAADLIIQLSAERLKTPNPLPEAFGSVFTDHMLTVEWTEAEGWGAPRIEPFRNLPMHPACSSLHYGVQVPQTLQECFIWLDLNT